MKWKKNLNISSQSTKQTVSSGGNECQKSYIKHIKNNTITDIYPSLSVVNLKVNELNSPVIRQMLEKWIKTQDPTAYNL